MNAVPAGPPADGPLSGRQRLAQPHLVDHHPGALAGAAGVGAQRRRVAAARDGQGPDQQGPAPCTEPRASPLHERIITAAQESVKAAYVAAGPGDREIDALAAGFKAYASWHATRTLGLSEAWPRRYLAQLLRPFRAGPK